MKLIYITSKTYPSDTADKIYVRELASSFSKVLKEKFLLVVANNHSLELNNINYLNLRLKYRRLKSVYYFLWLPFWVARNRSKNKLVFFSNDPYLLTILIFWRKLGFTYRVCSDWHQLFGDWRDKIVAESSDILVTTTQMLKRGLVSLKVDSNKIHVVYGGIDLEGYPTVEKREARQTVSLPEDKKIIGYVGFYKTMGMEKGIRIMIDALKLLSSDYIMAFVGGTQEEIVEYSLYAQTQGVANRCIFIERKSFNEVVVYEQAMDMLVIPYPDEPHFRRWGFPMKVYEYLASRRPIIYSRLDIIDEVLSDIAWSFEPGNSQDLSEVIKKIANDTNVNDKVAKAYKIAENSTWGTKAVNIINLIG
ncbi:MAG: glycosyltransferase [Candidatus Zambryskibacteria bacterium]|nr:glycosyltransferase [Candidatus Zambryskibacteria bacterium]